MKSSRDPASLNPFEIHLILLDSALANWRPYIVGLTEQITKQVCRNHYLMLNIFAADLGYSQIEYWWPL